MAVRLWLGSSGFWMFLTPCWTVWGSTTNIFSDGICTFYCGTFSVCLQGDLWTIWKDAVLADI